MASDGLHQRRAHLFFMISRFFQPLLDLEKRGRFSLSLLVADAAVAAWLFFAQRVFLGQPEPSTHTLGKYAIAAAGLAFVLRLHDFTGGRLRPLFIKAALFVPLVAAAAIPLHTSIPRALWLGGMLAGLLVLGRLAFFAARARWPDHPLEMLRWLFVLSAATALTLPFYTAGTFGTGDSYWYTIMLADFTAQLRAGVFPVWAGQSEYAFNGAVSPLRFAPWFQHAGGLLDFATFHALSPVALKNAVLAVNSLAIAASAYGCLRVVLARLPGLAAMLATLWVASPGVLSTVISSDLIMTYLALPFLPLIVLGCWLVWTADDTRARLVLGAGLAGAWISHTPIALWATFLAAGFCGAHALRRFNWGPQLRRAVLTAGIFILLGSFPLLSVLALGLPDSGRPNGAVAYDEIVRCFPANFKPLVVGQGAEPLFTFQAGYTALAAFGAVFFGLQFLRARAAIAFTVATAAVAVFMLPVPVVTRAFWTHVPSSFVAITNVWPMQRLTGLWALLMFFTFAIAFTDERLARRTWLTTVALLALAAGGVWSWREADKLGTNFRRSTGTVADANNALALRNLSLTRYAYTAFGDVPAYFSHGYMDPYWENRLLTRDTYRELAANADYAAPAVRLPVADGIVPGLMQTGVLTAVKVAPDTFTLEPRLTLAPGQRHALRLDFPPPAHSGVLHNNEHGQFRQYILPDSGMGRSQSDPPRAFGSLPTSSGVIPLQIAGPQPAAITWTFYARSDDPSPPPDRFVFARYALYTYTPAALPVVIDSWIPYRARTEVAQPAWLETPRVWIEGYRATVNARPVAVQRSPHNLVMIPLEPGSHQVTLEFTVPLWLRAAYWLSLAGWLALLFACARRVLAGARQFAPAPANAG